MRFPAVDIAARLPHATLNRDRNLRLQYLAALAARRSLGSVRQAQQLWKGSEMKRRVVRFSMLVALACLLGSGSIQAQESSTKAAQASVEAWLPLVDNQSYAVSWDTAASLFKAAITQEKWEAAAQTARAPLGQLKLRTLKSATSTTTLPGAPDGEYVVFQFNTTFEQKSAAVETVTAMREKDGTWHVGGYFIR
jgi:hypothetical protein